MHGESQKEVLQLISILREQIMADFLTYLPLFSQGSANLCDKEKYNHCYIVW